VPVAALDRAPVRRLPVMPETRAGCGTVPRPCPFDRCEYHLAQLRRRPAAPGVPSCSLDVADQGGTTLEEIGAALGVTRERVRQIQVTGLRHLAAAMVDHGLLTQREAARVPGMVRELLTAAFATGVPTPRA
jgi:hypothetical protein